MLHSSSPRLRSIRTGFGTCLTIPLSDLSVLLGETRLKCAGLPDSNLLRSFMKRIRCWYLGNVRLQECRLINIPIFGFAKVVVIVYLIREELILRDNVNNVVERFLTASHLVSRYRHRSKLKCQDLLLIRSFC